MKLLEERILKDGVIINNDILKVDSFLNHQIDTELTRSIAKEIADCFKGFGVNKILTIETSGLPVSFAVAEEMGNLPLVFAKKSKSLTVGDDVYKAVIKSFTRNIQSTVTVANRYLNKGDVVLIVDDLLATGGTVNAAIKLVEKLGASVVGCAFVIELVDLKGRENIGPKYPILSLLEYEGE